jgi:hypothetical protein
MKVINAPQRYDIKAYRGDTLSLPFEARDASGVIDITGHAIAAQIRRSKLDATVVASFTVFVEDAANGLYTLVLTASDFATVTCGETAEDPLSNYVWDTQITTPAGAVKTTHAGTFIALADVTRSA